MVTEAHGLLKSLVNIPQFLKYIKDEYDLIDILKKILDQNFQE